MDRPNFIANGNIVASTFVKLDASQTMPSVIQAAANSDKLIGVSKESTDACPTPTLSGTQYAAVQGENCHVYQVGEYCMIMTGAGGLTQNDFVTSDGSGNGITASAGQIYGAIALMTAPASTLCRVRVTDPIKM
jgi:hypothetical protein